MLSSFYVPVSHLYAFGIIFIFAYTLIKPLIFSYWVMSSLYVLDRSLLIGDIFSYSVVCLFTFLLMSFETHNFFFILMKSNYVLLLLLLMVLMAYPRNHCPLQRHKDFHLQEFYNFNSSI